MSARLHWALGLIFGQDCNFSCKSRAVLGAPHRPAMRQIYQELHRAATARSTERGFNGWYTYGVWYAAMTAAVSVAGLLACKIWGPRLGEIDPPVRKGHTDLRTGEVHYFVPRTRPSATDESTNRSESDAPR